MLKTLADKVSAQSPTFTLDIQDLCIPSPYVTLWVCLSRVTVYSGVHCDLTAGSFNTHCKQIQQHCSVVRLRTVIKKEVDHMQDHLGKAWVDKETGPSQKINNRSLTICMLDTVSRILRIVIKSATHRMKWMKNTVYFFFLWQDGMR